MRDFNYKSLSPFKWYVLENFPYIEADFDALTDWQLFCKLGKELNKVINNLNSIGTQTQELTDFVINYFDNLDVQEEVDNKLNEMAESGQLTDIIAQYLQLAGVLAYDTVANMKTATNLVNGSITKTLGYSNYNDGDGSFYKIRQITSQDVIDEINIISLNFSDTLIAEKINSNDILILKKNFANFFFAVYFDRTTLKMNYFTSLDGIQWAKQNINHNLPDGRDPSLIYIKEKKKFYLTYSSASNNTTFRIGSSSDLINWEWKDIYINGFSSERRCWAPDLMYVNNKLYVTFSAYNPNQTMQCYLCYTEDIDNLETWSTPYVLNLNLEYCIDSQIKYINGIYYLIVKNGENENIIDPIKIYTSEDLITWNILNSSIINAQVEGANLVPYNDKFLIDCDLFIERGHAFSKINQLNDTSKFIWTESNGLTNKTNDVAHGSIIYVDDENVNSVIKNLNINFSGSNFDERNYNEINLQNDYENFVVLPGYYYNITGNPHIVNLINPFDIDILNMKFATNVTNTLQIDNVGHDLQHMVAKNIKINNSTGLNEQMFTIDLHSQGYNASIPRLQDVDISSYWKSPSNLQLLSAKLYTHGTMGFISIGIKANSNITNQWTHLFEIPDNLYHPLIGGMITGDRLNVYQLNNNNLFGNITLQSGQTEYVRIPFLC